MMRRTRIFGLAAALGAALAAAVLWGTAAQASRTPAATQPAKTRPAKKQPGAIVVHGRWVITVRNKRGKIVQRRRFENHLTGNGNVTLVHALDGMQIDPTQWEIHLIGSTAAGPLDAAISGTALSHNVDVNSGATTFVLQGSYTPSSGATFTSVETVNALKFGSEDSASLDFTQQNLASPVTASAGQLVQAKVSISFAFSG